MDPTIAHLKDSEILRRIADMCWKEDRKEIASRIHDLAREFEEKEKEPSKEMVAAH